MELPIATGFYEDASKPIASQQCINFIPQVPQTNAYSNAQLIGTPGITLRSTAGTVASRGIHVMGGVPYIVAGNTLYRENNDGTTTSLGTISGSGRVSMADNGTQLCVVVPGSVGYIFTASPDTLTQITDTDFTTTLGPSEQVVYKDGYFIHFNNSASVGTGKIFFISNLNNGLAYDALDFGSAEADPDEITGLHVNRNILYVCGEITLEPFQNIGGAGFPFQRIQGGVVPKGVKSKFSLEEFDEGFVFVGGGENEQIAVWRASGSSVQKISTAAIENELSKLTDTQQENIFSTVYADGGYFVTIHTSTRTFTYDSFASQLSGKPMWHERASKDIFGQDTIWRVNGIVSAYGKRIVSDNQSGNIGEIDKDVYTEYGTATTSIVSTAPFHNMGNRITVANMELFCESGVGNIVDPGSDPVVSRQFSDDGGFTFSNATDRKLGKQGEYGKRQIWRKEGQVSESRVYRFLMSDPVKRVIIKLQAEPA